MSEYAHPEVLVENDWLAARLLDGGLRVVEVDVDTSAYESGHIPGALAWDWRKDLCDTKRRNIVPKQDLEELLGRSGIDNTTPVVLYGDHANWFACWAFWQLKVYGHQHVALVNGGRRKWLAERRPLSMDRSHVERRTYHARPPDYSLRAYLSQVMARHASPHWALIDVRSPEEYAGRITAPADLPESCQRGGHIPGAHNVPWEQNCNADGTFKSVEELRALYEAAGVGPDQKIITYCRIGERAALSWFVLTYLLGRDNVVNYDGSWTEWGNMVDAPVHTGTAP